MLLLLLEYLRTTGVKVYEIAELSPEIIGVAQETRGKDDFGFLIYFDSRFSGPIQAEKFDVNVCTPTELKKIGLGVMQRSFRGRHAANMDECLLVAREKIIGKYEQFMWHEAPKMLEVPTDLQP